MYSLGLKCPNVQETHITKTHTRIQGMGRQGIMMSIGKHDPKAPAKIHLNFFRLKSDAANISLRYLIYVNIGTNIRTKSDCSKKSYLGPHCQKSTKIFQQTTKQTTFVVLGALRKYNFVVQDAYYEGGGGDIKHITKQRGYFEVQDYKPKL